MPSLPEKEDNLQNRSQNPKLLILRKPTLTFQLTEARGEGKRKDVTENCPCGIPGKKREVFSGGGKGEKLNISFRFLLGDKKEGGSHLRVWGREQETLDWFSD